MILTIEGVDVLLDNITPENYNNIRNYLKSQLTLKQKKRDAVLNSFVYAMQLVPLANPSDVWHHIIYRSFIDLSSGGDAGQSWKRVGGESLELFFQTYYAPLFEKYHIRITTLIGKKAKKEALCRLGCQDCVGEAKLDVILEGEQDGEFYIFGGVHVKASLAERVSDDVPTSEKIKALGYFSPLVTFDVKSFPVSSGGNFINKGELGTNEFPSEKRKYIELHGSFDNCYSYNLRTIPSKGKTPSGKYIYVQGLIFKEDAFVKDAVSFWNEFSKNI